MKGEFILNQNMSSSTPSLKMWPITVYFIKEKRKSTKI